MFCVFLLLVAVYLFGSFFSSFLFLDSSQSCHLYTGETGESGDLHGSFRANVFETKME
jgi:hypothetical protein